MQIGQKKTTGQKMKKERNRGRETDRKPNISQIQKTGEHCIYAKRCGGCDYQGILYSQQLSKKQSYMRKLMEPFGKINPIIGMDDPYHYRHKVQAAFSCNKRGHIVAGVLFAIGVLAFLIILKLQIPDSGEVKKAEKDQQGRTKVTEMSQKHLERELLVEIDLETDTSRMLYDTRNNRTRIVGYREGNVYLLKDHIVYKNVLKTGEQREMYDLGQESMLWYEEDGEHKDVHFEWYGDYMVVWSYNNGDGENLVTIKSLDMTR